MIHPEIAQHIPAIQSVCREFGVDRLEIFGSAVTDRFDQDRSDVDFIVRYPDEYDFGLWLVRFFDFERALSSVVGRNVDLIMAGAPKNPRFIQEIDRTRTEIFNATEHAHVA